MQKIAIGSDHAGLPLKEELLDYLRENRYEPIDVGTYDASPTDYPDIAVKLSKKLLSDNIEKGILICGSGVGASIAANKIKGIRAGLCHDIYSAHQGVSHDNMNVICLGARVIGGEVAKELVQSFLEATFSDEERHRRRVGKILSLEKDMGCLDCTENEHTFS